MHLSFTEQELAFRDEVRAFFRDELPDDIVQKGQLNLSWS